MLIFIINIIFIEIHVFTANSVDPDHMPHSVVSDLGLHCLPLSLLWDIGIKKGFNFVVGREVFMLIQTTGFLVSLCVDSSRVEDNPAEYIYFSMKA